MELDYQEIGRNIRHYRQMRGIRQKELAELVHVSDQHISHIENGHTKLSLVTLVAIANVLQIDCNTLLGATLSGAKNTVLHQQLNSLVSEMDTKKLGLAVAFCNILVKYDLE
jgi:transcriptional regulator with XRE-family HTH domain